ncbi:MmgE/PrpD family protein [Chloroflexota bacterium]
MTLQHDLTWRELELIYRSSISYQFARYSLCLNYKMLPEDVVHIAKRCLLDALGCAIGGYEAPGRPICEDVAKELGGPEEATVIGSGLRTSAPNATLVNSFMVRFLDYNDVGGGGHNSDSIPAILAISEHEKTSGQDFLASLVISYELGARVRESFTGMSMPQRGWTYDLRGGLTLPPALGRLMGLNEDQIANAIGSCACVSLPLGILDSNQEENMMMKNMRFGWVAYSAILSCMLAKKGFTGPVRIVEGNDGWRQVLLQGDIDMERLVDFSGWRILDTRHKYLCADGIFHGNIYATLAIVKEQDLKPEDIAAVQIKAHARAAAHGTTSARKYPRNAESANHSIFYLNAIAIKERAVGPASIKPEKFTDPVILDLIEKIKVEADPSISERDEGISEITTKDGRKFEKRIDVPHGFGNDPLTDKELEEKFGDMAIKHMPDKQINKIFDTVWNIEKLDNLSRLMRLMVFPR